MKISYDSLMAHIISLGLFYAAIACFAYSTRYKKYKIVIEDPDTVEDSKEAQKRNFNFLIQFSDHGYIIKTEKT